MLAGETRETSYTLDIHLDKKNNMKPLFDVAGFTYGRSMLVTLDLDFKSVL
jgi:hypothetical protein